MLRAAGGTARSGAWFVTTSGQRAQASPPASANHRQLLRIPHRGSRSAPADGASARSCSTTPHEEPVQWKQLPSAQREANRKRVPASGSLAKAAEAGRDGTMWASRPPGTRTPMTRAPSSGVALGQSSCFPPECALIIPGTESLGYPQFPSRSARQVPQPAGTCPRSPSP